MVSGCFDHPAAARSAGVLSPGQLLLSCGTSWVGLLPCCDRQTIIDHELLCDPFLSEIGGPWAGLFSIPCLGPNLDEYVRRIIAPGTDHPYAVFEAAAASASPGAGGLIIDPREPVRQWPASRENISRAVMEGAARLLAEKLAGLRSRGFHFQSAVLTGGPSRSPLWTEIIGILTGLPPTVGTVYGGAKGAALLAGLGAGIIAGQTGAFQFTNHALQHSNKRETHS